jgi:hypothetical protein
MVGGVTRDGELIYECATFSRIDAFVRKKGSVKRWSYASSIDRKFRGWELGNTVILEGKGERCTRRVRRFNVPEGALRFRCRVHAHFDRAY